MSDEYYSSSGSRKTKRDKKMKRRNRVYKKGGKFRTMNVNESS